ncbi:MAG TPA: hypothetical protein VFX50_00300, partial [Gemmatimonadales bacterium]|nr:hypothetical protein [Gemmatimonadales bacterium]
AALVVFDLATGAERRRVRLADGLGGDIAVAPDGAVFAADSKGRLLVLQPGDSTPRVLGADALLRSPQGIVVRPDGRELLVADYAHGLLRVDLATGGVSVVPGPADATLLGIDGLVQLPDGRVAAMQNGIAPPRVLGLTLDEAGRAVTRVEVLDRHLPHATEPTLGAVGAGRLVYVANSPWANYDDAGAPRAGAAWPRPLLLAVPLR